MDMPKRPLGKTDLEVSLICLGTMTWGEQNTETEAHEQLDYALSQGVNFIDTAEMYPVPPQAPTQGRTESYIGSWLAARKNRDQVILATKAAGPGDWIKYLRGGPRFSKESLTQAIELSLKRLKTDYIDLYQLHWPERVTNFFGKLGYVHVAGKDGIPIAETLAALGDLVQAGKIRQIGLSNETPWGLMQFLRASENANLPRVVSIQNPYSLLNRTFEIGLAEMAIREQVGLLAYSPLAFGMLTGKYAGGARPEGARLTLYKRFSRYTNPQAESATDRYVALAKEHGLEPAQMALAYINSRDFVTSNIIGATTIEQLRTNIASAAITLSKEILAAIESIHAGQPNPAP